MTRGYTTKPCHGCGSTDMHRTDEVCRECKHRLERAEQWETEHGAAGKVPTIMPERDYWLPYLDHEVERNSRGSAVRAPLHALLFAISEPTTIDGSKRGHLLVNSRLSGGGNVLRVFDSRVPPLVQQLWDGIQATVKEAHRKGFNEGRNLLMSLASGRITSDKFNEHAARITEEDKE